jgi:hypothetical protein
MLAVLQLATLPNRMECDHASTQHWTSIKISLENPYRVIHKLTVVVQIKFMLRILSVFFFNRVRIEILLVIGGVVLTPSFGSMKYGCSG